MARPPKHIDWNIVQNMLEAQCLGTEIASYFGMHPNTFYDRVVQEHGMSFTEYSSQKKEIGKSKVRMSQYKSALKGNHSMQIWWGKNYLKQRDNPVDADEINPQIERLLNLLKDTQMPPKINASENASEKGSRMNSANHMGLLTSLLNEVNSNVEDLASCCANKEEFIEMMDRMSNQEAIDIVWDAFGRVE